MSELPLALQIRLLRLLEDELFEQASLDESFRAELGTTGHLDRGCRAGDDTNCRHGVVLLDAEGRIVHANEPAASLLGLNNCDISDEYFESFGDVTSAYFQVRDKLRQLEERSNLQRSQIAVRVCGHDRTFLLNPMAVPRGKFASGTLIVLRDVTDSGNEEHARIGLAAALSRELRTPLTSIGLAVQLLDQRIIRKRKLKQILASEFQRLSQLAEELIDVTGQVSPEIESAWRRRTSSARGSTGRRHRGRKPPR